MHEKLGCVRSQISRKWRVGLDCDGSQGSGRGERSVTADEGVDSPARGKPRSASLTTNRHDARGLENNDGCPDFGESVHFLEGFVTQTDTAMRDVFSEKARIERAMDEESFAKSEGVVSQDAWF